MDDEKYHATDLAGATQHGPTRGGAVEAPSLLFYRSVPLGAPSHDEGNSVRRHG